MNKFVKFIIWLFTALILNCVFIIPVTKFVNTPISLFLSIIWGAIIGIVCLPFWFNFIKGEKDE